MRDNWWICCVLCTCLFTVNCVTYKDIVFVVDRSASIGDENLTIAMDFVYNVTQWLTVGPNAIDVAILSFSTTPKTDIDLGTYSNITDLLQAIENLGLSSNGGTDTASALFTVRNMVQNNGRSGAKKAVVVMTDGLSDDTVKSIYVAELLQAVENVSILTVGIGNAIFTNNEEIRGMASDPEAYHVHFVYSFIYICNLIPTIVPKLDPESSALDADGCPPIPPELQDSWFPWVNDSTTTTSTTSPATTTTTSTTTTLTSTTTTPASTTTAPTKSTTTTPTTSTTTTPTTSTTTAPTTSTTTTPTKSTTTTPTTSTTTTPTTSTTTTPTTSTTTTPTESTTITPTTSTTTTPTTSTTTAPTTSTTTTPTTSTTTTPTTSTTTTPTTSTTTTPTTSTTKPPTTSTTTTPTKSTNTTPTTSTTTTPTTTTTSLTTESSSNNASTSSKVQATRQLPIVFSPRLKADIAVRVQMPLKLAFAITIHKAQGMTLSSVEVDCQQIFRPGQLAVAVGRVKTISGLRVINFHRRFCIPQPDTIYVFMNTPSLPPDQKLSCCHNQRFHETDETMTLEPYVPDPEPEFDCSADIEDDDFDELFKQSLSQLPEIDQSVDFTIPDSFHIVDILKNLKTESAVTSVQRETNDLIAFLQTGDQIKQLEEFCKKEFIIILNILNSLNITPPVPVKSKQQEDFYRKCNEHQISEEYRLNCLVLFKDVLPLTKPHFHITFNIFVSIRKFLMNEKVMLYSESDRELQQRRMTSASRARVRYVGGYCISKVRFRYIQIQKSNCFKTSVTEQQQYEEASTVVRIMSSLTENETYIANTSCEPETLSDTCGKQQVSRGLTHISDDVFDFFMVLCQFCLNFFTESNITTHCENLYRQCLDSILQSNEIQNKFINLMNTRYSVNLEKLPVIQTEEIQATDTIITEVLHDLVVSAAAQHTIFMEIIKKFLSTILNQYRKDVLEALSIQKTMAHRKQIQVRQKKTETSKTEVTYQSIVSDNTENKTMSHHLLKGILMTKSDAEIFSTMTKKQIQVLCKAYSIVFDTKSNKNTLTKNLRREILSADCMSDVGVFKSLEINRESTASLETESQLSPSSSISSETAIQVEPQPSTSTSELQPGTSFGTSHSQPSTIDECQSTDETCKKCHKVGTASSQWIQCDGCMGWFHRNCAGLKSVKKWKKYSKEGVDFWCNECL